MGYIQLRREAHTAHWSWCSVGYGSATLLVSIPHTTIAHQALTMTVIVRWLKAERELNMLRRDMEDTQEVESTLGNKRSRTLCSLYHAGHPSISIFGHSYRPRPSI